MAAYAGSPDVTDDVRNAETAREHGIDQLGVMAKSGASEQRREVDLEGGGA